MSLPLKITSEAVAFKDRSWYICYNRMFVALKLWFSTPAARWIHLGAESRKTPTQCQNSTLTQINKRQEHKSYLLLGV